MPFAPIQSALAGESVQQNIQATYGSNVALGDLLLTHVWWLTASSATFSISDDNGNTWNEDVVQEVHHTSGYYMRCSIFSAVSVTGGVKPTITVTVSRSWVIGGICIQEYGVPLSPRFDASGSAVEDGSGGTTNPTTTVTTTGATRLLVDMAAIINGQVDSQGTGWTLHDVWPGDAYIAYKTSGSSGSYTADMFGTAHSPDMGWVIVAAAYRLSSGVAYTDSISLGTASSLLDSSSAGFDSALALGMTASDVPAGSGAFSQAILMGLIQTFAEILQSDMRATSVYSQGYVFNPLPSVSYTYQGMMGLSSVIATAVFVSMAGSSSLGVLSHLADIGTDDTSGTASLSFILGTLPIGQRAFIDALSFGILHGLVADSGKAIVDVISFSGILGSDATPVYQGSGTSGLGTGILNAPQVNINFSQVTMLAYLLATQADTGSKALEALLGLAIGSVLAARPGVLFQDKISLQEIYRFLDSLPGGILPGLATVFAQLVYKGLLSDASGSATLSDQKVFKGEVSDI